MLLSNRSMPFFIRLEDAAKSLSVSTDILVEFEKQGWISFTYFADAGITYLNGHQHYRAKFIVTLRDRMQLSPQEIAKVLDNQQPPFSLASVSEILAKPD